MENKKDLRSKAEIEKSIAEGEAAIREAGKAPVPTFQEGVEQETINSLKSVYEEQINKAQEENDQLAYQYWSGKYDALQEILSIQKQ